MTRPVAIDITRVFTSLVRPTPRGIDRVEIGYARELLQSWPAECVAVLPTPWGIRFFDRQRSLRVLDLADAIWREARPPDASSSHSALDAWLAGRGEKPARRDRASPQWSHGARAAVALVGDVGIRLGKPVARALPRDSLYVNVGQLVLAAAPLLRWLGRRPDVLPIFMLHDVIPLEFPEYVKPVVHRFHAKMMVHTARYAAGLITTTQAAAGAVTRELQARGRPQIPTAVIPLPISAGFLTPETSDAAASGLPEGRYFVCLGAIEPRKNHLLLLHVWRDLVRRQGAAAPKLVIVGSRWRDTDLVVAMLERCPALRDHVCEVSGLPTPALRRLLRGARGLLMPSFAEGFGMPIIEGLATGTPVIASDLDAHKEAGGDLATYLSPLDGPGWQTAIEALADAPANSEVRAQLARYTPWLWRDYLARLTPFLESF